MPNSFKDIAHNIGLDHQPETWEGWFEAFYIRIESEVGEPMPNPASICADVVAEHLGIPKPRCRHE